MDLLMHRDDPDDPGVRVSGDLLDGNYVTGESCPRCGVHPLRAVPLRGCHEEREQYVYQAAGCVECGRHVGTLREAVSYWDKDEDDRVLRGRARVYGGEQVEGHGDRAREQFVNEMKAKGAR